MRSDESGGKTDFELWMNMIHQPREWQLANDYLLKQIVHRFAKDEGSLQPHDNKSAVYCEAPGCWGTHCSSVRGVQGSQAGTVEPPHHFKPT